MCVSFLPKSVPIHAKCLGDGTGERARERRRRHDGATETARQMALGRGARGFPSGGNVCRSGVPKRPVFPANTPKLRAPWAHGPVGRPPTASAQPIFTSLSIASNAHPVVSPHPPSTPLGGDRGGSKTLRKILINERFFFFFSFFFFFHFSCSPTRSSV